MITLNGVSKKYLKESALKDINLDIPSGAIIGLIGENGSGKSTTLKLIAGLLQPSRGTVLINEKKANRQIASEVAYLSELETFYDFYNVEESINYTASQFPDFNKEKAYDILKFMKLRPDQKVKHLSKGNRGRLKIVLTLAREVPIILMDEPLSGLDPMVRDSIIQGLISFIDTEKQTVIITTHEVLEVEPILDKVIAIKQGQLIGFEDVEELRIKENMSVIEWMKKVYQ